MFLRIKYLLLFLITSAVSSYSQEQPKLLVGIVVDQMRNDYIRKYWNSFGEDGFKKLVNNGFYAKNVNYSYKPTYTGPGHASIFTGATPSTHGIVANNWYSRVEGKMVYCAEALNEDGEYWYSPQRMLTRTIADEIKLFTNLKAKSYGVSLKDRGAILPAGHLADAAFWYEADKGGWISSNYYNYKNNKWIDKINAVDIFQEYLASGWEFSLAEENYQESLSDHNKYERPYIKGGQTSFPYSFKEAFQKSGANLIKATPQGNQLVIDFAKQLMKEEEIGKDAILDFLSISFSATDYIGHQFGVNSREVHDTYVKLDKQIASFLKFLEEEIGEANYLLFLTSDHGAGEVRDYLTDMQMPGGYIDTKFMKEDIEASLDKEFGEADYIKKITNLNVYLDSSILINSKKKEEVLAYSKEELKKYPGILKVFSKNEIELANNLLDNKVANGFMESESGDLILLEKPNWNTNSNQGSTHGSPYSYDTHVPLLFYGWNIKAGEVSKAYSVVDIVPTISILLGIPMPDGSGTRIIKEVK